MDNEYTMTSIETARRKFRWAMLIQLAVLGHALVAMIYASTGRDLYAAAVLIIIVFLLYAAISVAFTAGTHWPTGGNRNA